ncbi:hypothetical protein BASA81_011040 [Batrachochytrium salamandrivorans]|nr:hypothetical protein BASA81_011040 [Batrachochytrium salamandrivorans]
MATTSALLNQHFAESGEISILPNFRLGKPLQLLDSTRVGPFIPQTPTTVPLWLALLLKKQNKCKIIVPDWLSPDVLLAQRQEERERSKQEYAKTANFHYREVAHLLLKHCAEDFEDADLVRSLLEDLDNLRNVKIRSGLKTVAKNQAETLKVDTALNLTELSALELVEFRPFLTTGMDLFAKLGNKDPHHAAAASSYTPFPDESLHKPVKKLRRFR